MMQPREEAILYRQASTGKPKLIEFGTNGKIIGGESIGSFLALNTTAEKPKPKPKTNDKIPVIFWVCCLVAATYGIGKFVTL